MKYQKNRSKKVGIGGALSVTDLEIDIMKIAWASPGVTVREVHETIVKHDLEDNRTQVIPYTTVMSTMSGLVEKGLLKVDKKKKTYFYTAAESRQELSNKLIRAVARKLLGNPSERLISKFLPKPKDVTIENINSLIKEIDRL